MPTANTPLQKAEPKVLVIGFGNPLRGDDGAGWHAAEQLAKINDFDHIEILTCHQLTPELAEPISRAARVIFIDASANGPSGKISCQHVEPAAVTATSFSHECDPSSLLAIAQSLYGRHSEAVLLTIGGDTFDHKESLSPVVLDAMPALLQKARELMQ
jgi:hydrogenase maturation protease